MTHDHEILGGIPVFTSTRVPVQNLIDYLTTGETIDAFLDDFPAVTRQQVIKFLGIVGKSEETKVNKPLRDYEAAFAEYDEQ